MSKKTDTEKDTAAPVAEMPPRKLRPLLGPRLNNEDHSRNRWVIEATPSEAPEDFFNAEMFINIASRMRRFDSVTVFWDDRVLNGLWTGSRVFPVSLIEMPSLEAEEKGDDPRYAVRRGHVNEHSPWIAYRVEDDHVLNHYEVLKTELEARSYLASHAALRT